MGYNLDFKIDWLGTPSKGGHSNYSLVSENLAPTFTNAPLPATLPLMATVLGAGFLVYLFRRQREAVGSPFAVA